MTTETAPETQAAPSDEGRNLIVNYIPQTVDDDRLEKIFAAYGTVENAKVVKEKLTQKGMGYGFVKMSTEEEAENAIRNLNNTPLENKTLRVAKARPQNQTKNTNLYVAGLEHHYTKQDLETIFQVYGTVVDCKILTDQKTGQSRGVGFVRYETGQEAEVAAQALNGITLAGTSKPLTVRVAERKDNRQSMGMYGMRGNMRYNPIGMYNQMPGYQYANTAGFPPYQYVAGMPAQQASAGGNPPGICLFVFNLPPETDDTYLYQLFGPYGAVTNVRVIRDNSTHLCKGYGFVNMSKMEEATAAIGALNGAMIGTKTLQVSFKKDKN